MANLDALMSAGVIPDDHTLTKDDIEIINGLKAEEIKALIDLKIKLGEEFLRRNLLAKPNCFL
jgi:hypothetical protein